MSLHPHIRYASDGLAFTSPIAVSSDRCRPDDSQACLLRRFAKRRADEADSATALSLFAGAVLADGSEAIAGDKEVGESRRSDAPMVSTLELRVDGTIPTMAEARGTRDPEIRRALRDLLELRVIDSGTLIVNELPIAFGFAKMDVAGLNGRLGWSSMLRSSTG